MTYLPKLIKILEMVHPLLSNNNVKPKMTRLANLLVQAAPTEDYLAQQYPQSSWDQSIIIIR